MRNERTAGDIGYSGVVMDLRISDSPGGRKVGKMARIMIAHASISENGTVNGTPGDQTGGEVCVRPLYDRGWYCILRPNSALLALDIATWARRIAGNDNVGYSQEDRYSLYDNLLELYGDIELLPPCNCDCSSLVMAILRSLGLDVSRYMTTRSERSELIRSGRFEYLAYSKEAKLLAGDILLADGHTAIVCEVIPDPEPVEDPMVEFADEYDGHLAGSYVTLLTCNLRYGPYLMAGIQDVLQAGTVVRNYGYYSTDKRGVDWLLVQLPDRPSVTGFVSSNVIAAVPKGE